MLLEQLVSLATVTTLNVMEAGIAHALLGMADGADGLKQQHAQLLAVLEHLSEQGHAAQGLLALHTAQARTMT